MWRLVQALSTLTSPDGNTILVPGYYDAIRPPNAEEQQLYAAMLPVWSQREPILQKALDVRRWTDGGRARSLPNQTPEEALRLIRQHLDKKGFGDLEIRQMSRYPPAQSSVSAPMIRTAIGAGALAHAPNEYLVLKSKEGSKVAGLAEQEKFFVALLFAPAQ